MERVSGAELAERLAPAAQRWEVDLDATLPGLALFSSLLLEWGAHVNLTGAHSLAELCAAHLADAFPLMPLLPPSGEWIDVGSGAGLPGIVIAIARPNLRGVLLEPNQKRRAFLKTAIRALRSDLTVLGERLEDHAARVGAVYAVAISRAVFPLPTWCRSGGPLVRPGGALIGFASAESSRDAPSESEVIPYDVGAGPRAIVRVRM